MKFRIFTILTLLALLLASVVPLAAQDATECEDDLRLFDHELLATGPVCVPENPERIAMMETVGIELLFISDIQPVIQMGAYTDQLLNNFPTLETQLTTYLDDIPDAGYFEVNLEVLLEAEPDVIVIYDFIPVPTEQLNAIAPTVVVQLIPDVALERMLDFHADLLGLEEEVDALLNTYDERTAELGNAIGDRIEGESIVIVRVDPQLAIFSLAPAYTVLRDSGWQPSPDFAERLETITEEYDFGIRPVSMEELDVLDGDYLFAYDLTSAFDEDNTGTLAEITDSPLWQSLSVVDNDQFYRVPTYWNFSGVISSHFIIDDLFTYFSDLDPEEVSTNPFLADEEPDAEATN